MSICARFWQTAVPEPSSNGHEIIQSAPTTYVVDEARGVTNPLGMFCQRIGVAMHAVAVKPSPLQNLKLAVERCHSHVVGDISVPTPAVWPRLPKTRNKLARP